MNLASSIFGMNVQEINRTGHSIWPFVYTSVTLLFSSGLGFYFRRPLKRALIATTDPFVKIIGWSLQAFVVLAFVAVLQLPRVMPEDRAERIFLRHRPRVQRMLASLGIPDFFSD